MEEPLKINGYQKYLIQIGWFASAPNFVIALFGQDILAKTKQDALYMMNYLYPKSTQSQNLPYLCPIIEEVDDDTPDQLQLIYPN